MRTKVTLVLIFLNVALFFFIFKFERNWRTEAASLEARKRVLGPEAADISVVEVTSAAASGSFTLERKREGWFLKKPLEWPANPHAATAIVNQLVMLEHETSFAVADLQKNNQSIAEFGLEKPKVSIAFASGDPGNARPSTVLRLGDATPDGKRLYVLSPNGQRVHVVSRTLLDSLSVPIDQLRADTLLSVRVFEARSMIVQTGATAAEANRAAANVRVGLRRDPGGTRWTFYAPINALASKTAVELAINGLNKLRAKSFTTNATGPSPATAPTLRVMIEGNNRQETLYIGEPVAGTTAAPGGDVEYHAQLEGRNALFTVVMSTQLLDTLRNAQETLREKRFFEFEPSAVTAITLEAPILPNQPPVTLQRLEAPGAHTTAGANAGPSWQIVRRGDGGAAIPSPQSQPADRSAVQRLLERLALLSAEKFKSDAPTSADLEEWGFNQPAREVSLTIAGSTTPLVLRLGTDAARNLYARAVTSNDPGTSVYQVRPDILNDLPLSPLAWRDRAVAEPLPNNARIASLKLTDLEAKKVLFEASFTPAGEVSPAPANPDAVRQLTAGLRALRAKEFVPGGFAERITAAGDERPWRFQLEATIALPGPTGGEASSTLTVFLTERLGGGQQFAGIKELDTAFSLEQPIVDALWSLAYGSRDPGVRSPDRKD